MKLYRGYKTRPKFPVPKLLLEYEKLTSLKERVVGESNNIMGAISKMGANNLARWVEIAQTVGPQFFASEEKIARRYAGDQGFIISIDVPDEVAAEHYFGTDVLPDEKGARPAESYVFMGIELQSHIDDWNFRLIEIEKETIEGTRPSFEGKK